MRFGMSSAEFVQSVNNVVKPGVDAMEAVVDGGKLIPKTLNRILQFGSVSAELFDSVGEFVFRIILVVLVAVDGDDVQIG